MLVGEDGPGLKRADRRTLQTIALPQPYVHLYSYYKQELRMYGVEFGEQKRLAELAVRKCGKEKATIAEPAASTTSQQPSAPEERGPITFENKLVSSEWVIAQLKLRRFHTLIVRRRTLISPLALDLLKDNGIAVQYADEG